MEWRRASRVLGLCHTCHAPIAAGDVYAVTRRDIKRCARCASKHEPPPPTIVDDPPTFAPRVERQASLDIGERRSEFVSVSDLAARRANHLRQRRRR